MTKDMTIEGRPIIGVTGPDDGGGAAWLWTRTAIWLAGGHAVRITPAHPRSLEGLHGLVLGGGADVDPTLYGEQRVPNLDELDAPCETWDCRLLGWVLLPLTLLGRKISGRNTCSGTDAARDELERRLLDDAVRRGLPVLGICRGAQLLNVYFGGTLHQELTGFYIETPEIRTILPRKRIVVAGGTVLGDILGRRPRRVNALHRQAIHRLGRGMRIAARDLNGIVQAIEHEQLPFALGVQWHPEYLQQLPEQRRIFDALVRSAKAAAMATAPPRLRLAAA